MVFILLILIVCILLLLFFKKLFRSENTMLQKAISNHNQLVCALVQKAQIDKTTVFSEDEEQKIITMTEEDWKEWESQIVNQYKYFSANSFLVNDFIMEYFPNLFERALFKLFSKRMSKSEAAIRSLTFEEIQILISMSDDDWKKRREKLTKINHIINNNPDGIKTYKEIHKISGILSNSVLLREQYTIEHLQGYFIQAQNLTDWEKKQNDFSKQYRSHIREWHPSCGFYTYKIPYRRMQKDGSYTQSSYCVWQSFNASYSNYHLDEQPESLINFNKKIYEFKSRTRYYYDHVYIKVFDIIRNIETISEDKPLVVFINNCIYDWSKDTYDFHYRYLKSVLEQNQYTYTDIDNLYKLAKEQIFSCVMIIDFITTNKELSTNCNLILDYFKDNTPVIGYHSIIKEYSEKEILDLIEQENTDKDNEQNSIQYVKTLFLKVNKNDYFLYFAIINVLIGQANCSDEIKKTWLRNPDAIYVDGDSKDGIIKFTYSINGNDKQTFSMKGDGNSIDDVSKFSYLFLKETGLWQQFKENGHKAIDKMNTLDVLAHY